MRTRLLPTLHIADVEVRLDASVFVLIALVAWAFTTVFRTDNGIAISLTMAAVAAVLVVATTLAHELAHALEARHRGLEVEGVTLLLFGGITEMHADGQSARDELAIAVVGPWISLVCGAGFGLIATFAEDLLPTTVAGPTAQVAGVLGWWNVVLAVFNIVPGAPLDGGRVLRAVLWMVFGNRLAALRVSVRTGQLIGVALIGVALLAFVRGGSRAGLLAAAIALSGVFMIRAAARELRHAELDQALEQHRVGDLLAVQPEPPEGPGSPRDELAPAPSVDLQDDLHTLIDAFQGDHHTVRVVVDGRVVGELGEREVAQAVARLRRGRSLS